jgi:hypothetical protein
MLVFESAYGTAVRAATKRIRTEAALMNRDPSWLANRLFSMRSPGASEVAHDVLRQACSNIINAEMEGHDHE